MIQAHFFEENNSLTGFEISGHSLFAESGSDIVCAAVSSAAIMAANTLTEICGVEAQVDSREGYLLFKANDAHSAQDILGGLKLHLEQLAEQYPSNITVS